MTTTKLTPRARELRLTRQQRARFFNGEAPAIAGEGECPVGPGYVHHLSRRLSFTVTSVRRKGTSWRLQYTVTDRREDLRLLRRVPVIGDQDFDAIRDGLKANSGYPDDPTPQVIAAAGQESAYTAMPGAALLDAGEAVDERTQQHFTEAAKRDGRNADAVQQARRERHSLGQQLDRMLYDAELQGVDVSSPARVIVRQLRVLQKRVYEGRAA